MNIRTRTDKPTGDIAVLALMARLLARLEHSRVPVDAAQYRAVAQHLAEALAQAEPGPSLQALLDTHPAAAELYENLNYRHAGLCRSPLDQALRAEMAAQAAIHRAAGKSR
jgi:hypothetical protein